MPCPNHTVYSSFCTDCQGLNLYRSSPFEFESTVGDDYTGPTSLDTDTLGYPTLGKYHFKEDDIFYEIKHDIKDLFNASLVSSKDVDFLNRVVKVLNEGLGDLLNKLDKYDRE